MTLHPDYAAPPKIVFEIIRGLPPYPAPEGQEWTYLGNREWELKEKGGTCDSRN